MVFLWSIHIYLHFELCLNCSPYGRKFWQDKIFANLASMHGVPNFSSREVLVSAIGCTWYRISSSISTSLRFIMLKVQHMLFFISE